jgi:outer membrane protein insertion porin family
VVSACAPGAACAAGAQNKNPFEAVLQSAEPAKPAQPGQTPKPTLEAPKPVEEVKPVGLEGSVEEIQFRGARRVPQDTMRALIFTKKGDKFEPESLRRDFMALWNTGRFDDITLETEPGKVGMIVRFVVVERRDWFVDHLRGDEIDHRLRDSGPLQGAQSRACGRIAIRPQ